MGWASYPYQKYSTITKFENIKSYFNKLCEIGPKYGYFPEPSKSILICNPSNSQAAADAFKDFGFKITSGARYLGGFIGTDESKADWIKKQVSDWKDGIEALASIAKSSPQCAFVGMRLSLQSEWTHLQRVVKNTGTKFKD